MAVKHSRNTLLMILLLLTGVVLGSLLGEWAAGVPALSFLNYGKSFGIGAANPFVLDLWVLELTFGIYFRLNVSVILGMVASMLIYRKL